MHYVDVQRCICGLVDVDSNEYIMIIKMCSFYDAGAASVSILGITSFCSSKFSNSPDWCTAEGNQYAIQDKRGYKSVLFKTISHPPTNSPLTYN